MPEISDLCSLNIEKYFETLIEQHETLIKFFVQGNICCLFSERRDMHNSVAEYTREATQNEE